MIGRNSGVSGEAMAPLLVVRPPVEEEPPRSPLAHLVDSLRAAPRLGGELLHALRLPATPARCAALDPLPPPPLAAALAESGAEPLWSHQAEAIAAARAGEDVLVTTPTASGKSLVFQVPVLEEALAGRPGRALWLFPLKALAQDQKGKLDRLGAAAGVAGAGQDGGRALAAIYDGDTPRGLREAIRAEPPRVLITNPDMLHLGLLAHWPAWGPFLVDLRWIVLDELHAYRGILGSHFHHVLQRLLRLARELGARPSFVASSATAANAGEFAARLVGRPFRWIADSGAPREGRHLLLFRPEASPYTTALDLFVRLLAAGMKTIVFTKARRITELLGSWLAAREPALARRVAVYRSGFLPEERRKIEGDLFAGRLDGVISTSALEMGIDVGGLDACILVGYPGSVMATWQRSGRVGRAGKESLTALVALPDALDQWFLDHPAELVGRPCERLIVDPGNAPVARGHLVCAAAESPLRRPADAGYLDRHAGEVEALLDGGELLESADGGLANGGGLFARARRPHRDVHLRGTGATWAIVDARRGRTVGTLDGVRAFHEGHPGAVYLHAGRQYLVDELDLERHRVLAAPAEVDWYTQPLAEKETAILEVLAERRVGPLQAWLGRVRVTERVVGYERKRLAGRDTLSTHALDLPPIVFETVALWWAAPPPVEATLARHGEGFMGALHAAEHAAISLLPRLALCDRGDVGGISIPRHPQVGCGAVFVYDGHPGGVGIAAAGFAALEVLLADVAALVAACPCDAGCPSCIQSPKCGNGNRPLDKAGAVRAIRLLLGEEEPTGGWGRPVVVRVEEEAEAEGGEEGSARRGGGADRRAADRREGAAGGREASARAPTEARSREGTDRQEDGVGRRRVVARGVTSGGAGAGEVGCRAPNGDGDAVLSRAAPVAEAGSSAARQAAAGAVAVRWAGWVAALRRRIAAAVGRVRAGGGKALSSLPSEGEAPATVRPRAALPSATPFTAPFVAPTPTLGTLLFDLETLRSAADVGGWGNAHRMGVAIAVVCHLEEGAFETYAEDRVADLAAHLAAARLVVGFNVRRFDYRVLSGYTGIDHGGRLPTLDLLDDLRRRIGFRVGLGHLALETLGVGKSADGLQSLAWVREGRLDLVAAYCRRDVEVLRDLYLHGRREGWVCYRDRRRGERLRVRVDW